MKNRKRNILLIALLSLILVGSFSFGNFTGLAAGELNESTTGSVTDYAAKASSLSGTGLEEITSDADSADFELRMLDVGQGLAVLIKADGHYMLYDGGGRYTSSYVVAYLKKHGIKKLDYLVASHYDEDHIFGLVGVLNTTKVGTALTPNYKATTKVYKSFRSMMKKKKPKEVHPKLGKTYKLGGAKIKVIGPKSYKSKDRNDDSIAIRVTYGDFSVILTGDSSTTAESKIIKNNKTIKSTLYVVGHHGSSRSSGASFLSKVKPAYALISVGADNSYGHPHSETLTRLKKAGCKIYRTDQNGEITAYSDGKTVWFKTQKSDSGEGGKDSDDDSDEDPAADPSYTGKYVLNTNTMKFHYPSCYSVQQMAEHNKEYSNASRDVIIGMGYSPCGNCNP